MTAIILNFILFVLPLIVLPFGVSYFETPKVIIVELMVQFMLWFILFNAKAKIQNIKIYWPLFAIILLSLAQLILHKDFFGFFSNPFRLQGIFFLWNMLALVVVVGVAGGKKYPAFYPFLTLIALAASAGFYGTNAAGRFIGSMGEPNAYAAASLFVFSLVFFREKRGVVKVAACVLMIVVLLLSRSRSAAIGFGIEMIFYLLLRYKMAIFSRATYISIMAILITSFLPVLDSIRIFENRWEIWRAALYAGLKYPMSGWGIGRAEQGIRWGGEALQNNIRFQYVDSAHNILLDWWIIGGAPGVLLMCVVVCSTVGILIRRKSITEMAAFIGVLVTLWFNPGSVYTYTALWYLVGNALRPAAEKQM